MDKNIFFTRPNGNEQRLNRFHASIKEDEIGITEYVTPSSGFTGIIKHRYIKSLLPK